MLKNIPQKYIVAVCVFFFVFPKRIKLLTLLQDNPNRREYDPGFVSVYSSNRLVPAKWASQLIKDNKDPANRLEEAEPGFDLTEEEITKFKIWPQGIIPYYIDDYSFDKVLRDRIRTFLDATNGLTGLQFLELPRPPSDEISRWVFFINRRGILDCSDHYFKNFTNEGVQKVILGYDCLSTGGELAEVVLALAGVPPQHNAPNRNAYITVLMNNVIPEKKYLFEQLRDDEWLFHDVLYDYASAGHYHWHKYTINGQATINPNRIVNMDVGESNGFSYKDIWKIRMLYNYISKKKSKGAKGSECSKLFEPGTNFSHFEQDNENDIIPRKKPNKYLGLHEEQAKNPEEELSEDTNANGEETNRKKVDEESSEISKVEQQSDGDKSEVQSDENEKEELLKGNKNNVNPAVIKLLSSKKKVNNVKKLLSTHRDPLFYLSDYKTEDENMRNRKTRFKKNKKISNNI